MAAGFAENFRSLARDSSGFDLLVIVRHRLAELFPLLVDRVGFAGAVQHVELSLHHLGDRLARGAKIFADYCAGCHGADAKGNHDIGAPNLTSAVWLYGSDKATIIETVTKGRGGVMPAWSGRLDDTTIKALAIYVFTFGGGEK